MFSNEYGFLLKGLRIGEKDSSNPCLNISFAIIGKKPAGYSPFHFARIGFIRWMNLQ
jgi:hypothetical protein